MCCVADKQRASMTKARQAALVQRVVVPSEDGRTAGAWGDAGNMSLCYGFTQRTINILILLWRIGQSPSIPQAHQAVMAIRQPHIIDAQEVGDIVFKWILEY